MGHRTISLLLASLTTLICGAVSLFAYNKMVSDDEVENALIQGLTIGENQFQFQQDNKSCFGAATMDLSEEEHSLHVKLSGWFALKIGDRLLHPHFHGDISLNPLGQVGGTLIYITVGEYSFRVGTTNINPITLTFVSVEGEHDRVFNQNIPGPFEIKRSRAGSFFLSGPPVASSFSATESALGSYNNSGDFAVHTTRSRSAWCTNDKAVALDLSFLTKIAANIDQSGLGKLFQFLQ